MHQMWLFSMAQCVLSVSVIGLNVRLCMRLDSGSHLKSVSSCLKLCLGWVGAIGGAMDIPVNMLLNMRSTQCLYTCMMLVCFPLLVRQFTVWLLLLLILNTHLHCRLGHRYAGLVTRRRMLCLVLLSWLCSVVTAFAQFIVCNSVDTWGTAGLGFIWPNHTTHKPHPQAPSVIGEYLPYGGFLSKFLVEDMKNFTYAEIHSSHWGVCAHDTVLNPAFLVYVYDVAVYYIPLLILLGVYVDLSCVMSRQTVISLSELQMKTSGWSCSLVLSLCLLVLLYLPIHTIHALHLFAPSSQWPLWANYVASILFQTYGLVPPVLFSSSPQKVTTGSESLALKTATSRLKSISPTPLEFCLPKPMPKGKT
ncbi:adenosine receptor A1-like [Ictalurus furcatus]|uniref:adenosine receptor A1-like n=1 Tax=Ictalurus furcatus TaxID=66913 RepID=UPI00235083C3|nr:adenosine receptor A1-like [Ictalurus furcatus]